MAMLAADSPCPPRPDLSSSDSARFSAEEEEEEEEEEEGEGEEEEEEGEGEGGEGEGEGGEGGGGEGEGNDGDDDGDDGEDDDNHDANDGDNDDDNGDDELSYAEILRARNKFSDALSIYERVLEKDPCNVEAFVGKGICLHVQGFSRRAFKSFAHALTLNPKNACALTHCGILYREEGQLIEAAEVMPLFFCLLLLISV
jgi:tetratricopeptide (TPR) repeat protein